MLQPIEVMALDENMNRASGGIAYRSLIWRRRYYECGSFELYVPKNLYKTSWKYVYTNDRPEMGIIETVCATDDVHAWGGRDTVKVSGRFAESLIGKKVLLPSRVTGYGSEGDNVAVSMLWAEELHGDRFAYVAPDFEGVTRAMAPEAGPYDSILYDELKVAEASYRVLYDFTGNTWTLQPWKGLDRTQSQGGGIVPDPEPDEPDEPTIDDLYEPLDYIVATGEQYIDTGIYPNQGTRVTVNARFTSVSTDTTSAGNRALFGARNASASQFAVYHNPSSGKLSALYGSSTAVRLDDNPLVQATYDMSGNVFSIGGNSTSATAATFTSAYSLYLFAINNAGAVQYPGTVAMSGCQIYQDGTTLTQDLVPKRRIADGAVGMLDLVNEVFYPSASGVAFLAPGELPEGYTRLDCIESTGSQYIDTGVVPSNETRVRMGFKLTSLPTGSDQVFIFGSRNASTGAYRYGVTYPANYKYLRNVHGSNTNSFPTSVDHTAYHVIDKNGYACTLDDSMSADATDSTFALAQSLVLFASNENGTASLFATMQANFCEVYEDGESLSRDYVPAKNSSGEAGLFDLVTMTFYPDASGTGFVAGGEVTAVATAAETASYAVAVASEETVETAVINSFALFSDQLGNIRDYVATRDASNYKNTCLVDYEYEEPAKWNSDGTPYATPIYEWIAESSGTARELVGYQIQYNIKRGTITARIADDLPDDEAYLDLTGTKPPYDGEWSRSQYDADALPDFPTNMRASYVAFPAALEAEGFKHLYANYPYVEEIDTGELATGGYLRRWDLGDKVDALLLDIGIDMEARITGVDEVYEGATRSVTPIIGEKKHRKL